MRIAEESLVERLAHRTMTAATLEAVRGTYGVVQLTRLTRVAEGLLVTELDRRGRRVARLLGLRQLFQALASGTEPTAAVLALGVEVDLLHALSMLVLGVTDHRHRRAALTDAAIAASFAAWGAAATRTARRSQSRPDMHGIVGIRDAVAERLARRFVPNHQDADSRAHAKT